MKENNNDTEWGRIDMDRFARWQVITLEQLTYSINLILGFAVAVLGFQISLLTNEKFNPVSFEKCFFASSIVIITFAILFGIVCIINRLRDFRATKEIARMEELDESASAVQNYRDLAKRLGERTWILFWCQVGAFGVGIVLLLIGISGLFKKLL